MADIKEIEQAIEITKRHICALEDDLLKLRLQEYIDVYILNIEVRELSIQALEQMAEREKGCSSCDSKNHYCNNCYYGQITGEIELSYVCNECENNSRWKSIGSKFCKECGRDLRQYESEEK